MIDRDALLGATADSVFLQSEHDSDLKSVASRYVDAPTLEEVGRLYAANVADAYASERPQAGFDELDGVRGVANEMFVFGFVLACQALCRENSTG
jgi:hypothetical protein